VDIEPTDVQTDLAPVLVHVAGQPGPDEVQRCVSCGVELLDNRGRPPTGEEGYARWWQVGDLVAVDKPDGVRGPGVSYLKAGGSGLGARERPCTPAG
jgi:hypothetical protein